MSFTIKSIRAKALLISEISMDSNHFSSDKVSEFLVDGIILLGKREVDGKSIRSIGVEKMRETVIKEESAKLKISSQGMVVNNGSFYNITS